MTRARAAGWPTLIAVVVFSMGTSVARGSGTGGGIGSPIVFVQIPTTAEVDKRPGRGGGMLRSEYGEGGRIVRLDPGAQPRVLTEGFSAACELDVSFDGKRILFAAKRELADRWNVWEMNADGTGARQITRDLGNCRSPAYQATLYTIVSTEPWYQIMFVSDQAGAMNEYGSGPAASLYSCKLDGSAVRRLTMNLSDDMDPFLMDDGRVLLASWQRMDLRRGFRGRVALFGVNTDGADYALYGGDQGARIKHMPCATTDGLVVFVEADKVAWDGAGQLACVTRRRNFYSHRAITSDGKHLYHSPSPLPDGSILVSRRPADGTETHGLYRFNPRTAEVELVFDDPEFHDLHPRLLSPRPEPDGRSSVVDEQYTSGKLYCLNAYITDPQVAPHIRPGMIRRLRVIEGVPLPAGDRSMYLPDEQRTGIGGPGSTVNGLPAIVQRRLLGDVPVEADGSFHLELPPDVPVQLQTLDENGMALRSCGWIWVKPREPRGCIGCHEDPELTPENRFVAALKKDGIKLMLPPQKRRTVDFRRDVMPIITRKCASADCHGGNRTTLNLSSEPLGPFNQAYVNLLAGSAFSSAAGGPVMGPGSATPAARDGAELASSNTYPAWPAGHNQTGPTKPHGRADACDENKKQHLCCAEQYETGKPVVGKYVHPGQARTSRLIWWLFGRNTSRPWDPSHRQDQGFQTWPPPEAKTLTEDEKLTFVEWIDLGAHWDGVPGAEGLSPAQGTKVQAGLAR